MKLARTVYGLIGGLIGLSLTLAPHISLAATKVECQQFDQPVKWSYCLTTTIGSSNDKLLYFLHGRTKGAHAWNEVGWTQKIGEIWGENAPRVAAVSFGRNWLLAEKNTKSSSGLYEIFVGHVMPAIEKRLERKFSTRLLMGESMGGFNASQLYLKNPELFERAALLCPAISTVSPFASFRELMEYKERTGARSVKILIGRTVSRMFYDTPESWQKSDPLTLGTQRLSVKSPAVYVSCGNTDDYGFYEGASLFAHIAQTRGVDVEWVPLSGGHCTVDPDSVAQFMMKSWTQVQ